MKIGVVLPQTEIGNDPAAIKAYAEAAEDMGFTHILVFDHVLGANPERPGGWKGPYTFRHAFHEPFVLFGFLAAATRRLELVTFSGREHRISDAGLNPLPVQRPIPIWMGGESEVVQQRMARLADGWMPHFRAGAPGQAAVDRIHRLVREAGRDPKAFGIEGRMALSQIPQPEWGKEMEAWRAMRGVSHLCVHTAGMGLAKPADHIETLRRFREVVGLK